MNRIPVKTKADLETLNSDEILEGYRDGYWGDLKCGDNRSRSYWHGWRNGRVDGGYAETDDAQMLLVHDVRGKGR